MGGHEQKLFTFLMNRSSPYPDRGLSPFFWRRKVLYPIPVAVALEAPTISILLSFDPLTVDVLDVFAKAAHPISYSNLVRSLLRRGHDKTAAKLDNGPRQKWRWIEYDLVSDYRLHRLGLLNIVTYYLHADEIML